MTGVGRHRQQLLDYNKTLLCNTARCLSVSRVGVSAGVCTGVIFRYYDITAQNVTTVYSS